MVTSALGIDQQKMVTAIASLSKAATTAAREGGIIPMDCQYECHVEITIGPDGKPVPTVVCGMVCD